MKFNKSTIPVHLVKVYSVRQNRHSSFSPTIPSWKKSVHQSCHEIIQSNNPVTKSYSPKIPSCNKSVQQSCHEIINPTIPSWNHSVQQSRHIQSNNPVMKSFSPTIPPWNHSVQQSNNPDIKFNKSKNPIILSKAVSVQFTHASVMKLIQSINPVMS
jgi:hypothetical protein